MEKFCYSKLCAVGLGPIWSFPGYTTISKMSMKVEKNQQTKNCKFSVISILISTDERSTALTKNIEYFSVKGKFIY
jgi:hypothetical protein